MKQTGRRRKERHNEFTNAGNESVQLELTCGMCNMQRNEM